MCSVADVVEVGRTMTTTAGRLAFHGRTITAPGSGCSTSSPIKCSWVVADGERTRFSSFDGEHDGIGCET
jgi:hypothetical protein